MIEFTPYPKTARLFKDAMVVTEKIDGTNAAVVVAEGKQAALVSEAYGPSWRYITEVEVDGVEYTVAAQSRNRMIAPQAETGDKGSDNYAFAQFVWANAESLARVLGTGVHFGEWWGAGIARNYGLTERRFSLFNTSRWKHLNVPEARLAVGAPKELQVVPVLAINTLDTQMVLDCMELLAATGSRAVPGFMDPEGICVFMPSSGTTFKVTFEGDRSKFEMAALIAA